MHRSNLLMMNNCLFETCRWYFNWNKLMRKSVHLVGHSHILVSGCTVQRMYSEYLNSQTYNPPPHILIFPHTLNSKLYVIHGTCYLQQSVSYVVSPCMVAALCRKPAPVSTSWDSCHAQGSDERGHSVRLTVFSMPVILCEQ
jgi:hypothetical protein